MRHGILALAFVGCGGSETSDSGAATDADTDTDTDSDADTDTDTDPTGASCTSLTEGEWTAEATSCFGMVMIGTLTLGTDGCSFEFSEWNMMMDVPLGGTVTGASVTLTGDGWEDCTGTTDGTTMSGTCADDGCVFEMAAN